MGLPFITSAVRFCRTLYTASPGAGTPRPQTPILAWPERSITRLARPRCSALATWPSCSYPPTPEDSLNPPLNAASSRLRSAPATTGPALTRPAAAPGSSLPLCRTYVTGPVKVATVTTDPSAVRIRVTVTRGAAGAAGTASPAWLAPGLAGADEAAEARAVAEPVAESVAGAPARLDGPPGCVAAGGELQAAIAHRPARTGQRARADQRGGGPEPAHCLLPGASGRLGAYYSVTMSSRTVRLTGWGRISPSRAELAEPATVANAARLLETAAASRGAIARGLGRSYNNAAQCAAAW